MAIPVGLAAATESKSTSFRQEPWEEVGRGIELPDGRILDMDDELAERPLPSAHTIEISQFLPATTIDPIY
ncbi:Ku family protein [Saccharopolyspora pogona]|uniref:hypothetical protein n=1 Tax=Saccharopolyspora pogona TaxID=333966 RepID=UPI0016875FDA|nr:hypothetical protein [Saccharopolyspora pogona]